MDDPNERPDPPRDGTSASGPAATQVPSIGEQKELHGADGRFLPGVRQPGATIWQPGQSGNPDGINQAARLTKKLIEALERNNAEMADALIRVALREALKGKYQFWEHIYGRVEGTIAQRLAGHDGGPLPVAGPVKFSFAIGTVGTEPKQLDSQTEQPKPT